ncbi:MAG TPA: hypothetical protein VJ476_08500 [Rhizomicrobium sp.]|nr:hypothetical protein [Rhizomicrobium sp.]
MRAVLTVSAVLAAASGGPAAAAQLVLPEPKPVFSDTYSEPSPPWIHEQPNFALTEKPVGEIIAIKLGFAEGRAELFRYNLEDASSEKTTLDGVVEGGGLKLKLTW